MLILHATHKTSQAATALFAEQTKDADTTITVPQAIVLEAVRANEGATQTALVGATGIDRSTMADIIKRMKAKNWVDRRRTKQDARAYAVKITPEGAKQLALAKTAASKAEKALVAKYPGVKALANGSKA